MIVMCQNKREESHLISRQSRGVVNLGLGKDVSPDHFMEAFTGLIRSRKVREKKHGELRAMNLKQGIRNVWDIILRARRT